MITADPIAVYIHLNPADGRSRTIALDGRAQRDLFTGRLYARHRDIYAVREYIDDVCGRLMVAGHAAGGAQLVDRSITIETNCYSVTVDMSRDIPDSYLDAMDIVLGEE